MNQLLERTGRVISNDGHAVRIAFEKLGDCANCRTGSGCGIGPVLGMNGSSCLMRLGAEQPDADRLAPGDLVRIGVNARQLTVHVLLVYLLPLAGLAGGAVCAGAIEQGPNDLAVGIGAIAGLLCAYIGARALRYFVDLDTGLQPNIKRLSVGR